MEYKECNNYTKREQKKKKEDRIKRTNTSLREKIKQKIITNNRQ